MSMLLRLELRVSAHIRDPEHCPVDGIGSQLDMAPIYFLEPWLTMKASLRSF